MRGTKTKHDLTGSKLTPGDIWSHHIKPIKTPSTRADDSNKKHRDIYFLSCSVMYACLARSCWWEGVQRLSRGLSATSRRYWWCSEGERFWQFERPRIPVGLFNEEKWVFREIIALRGAHHSKLSHYAYSMRPHAQRAERGFSWERERGFSCPLSPAVLSLTQRDNLVYFAIWNCNISDLFKLFLNFGSLFK